MSEPGWVGAIRYHPQTQMELMTDHIDRTILCISPLYWMPSRMLIIAKEYIPSYFIHLMHINAYKDEMSFSSVICHFRTQF